MPSLNFDAYWRDHGAAKGMRDLGKDADSSRKHVESLGNHGKQLAAGFAGFAAASIFRSFIDGARESNAISRITEQRIRSTGGAAHVTADQVGDLATAISNKTGADDEAVQSGSNMLLTFTSIRNEVGRGNDVFNQATQAATDLAAGLNQGQVTAEGTQQAATLLGKALNDPIAGMTALRRVGISFTASQVAQITALQKSGQTLEAQKVILGEVNREFGGTARAAADPLQRMSVILGNVGEDLGNKLLPALNKGADLLAAIPGPVYVVGAAFVTLGVGAIGVAKGINAVKDIAAGTNGILRILGLRTGEVAAAEVTQAAAADASAASTAAAGDAAAVAGTKFGALAGKLGLAGAIVGLGALSAEATAWSGRGDVASVSTDKLAASLLQMQQTGQASGAAFDLLNVNSMRFKAHIDTSTEALTRFGAEAQGAFAMGLSDIIGRAQSGNERLERFNATAGQMDAALAQLVTSGHGAEAAQLFQQLMAATGLTGDELEHVRHRFLQYQAAEHDAAAAADAVTAKIGDTNSVLLGVQHGGNVATTALLAVAGATTKVGAAAKLTDTQLDALANGTLSLRAADRDLAGAQADLSTSISTNGRTLSNNTAAGRANAAALDDVARKTRETVQAHRNAGEPLREYAARIATARDRLIEEARRAGMSATAARDYANKILAVPLRQTTQYRTPGLPEARKNVQGLATDLSHIAGRTIQLRANADGSFLRIINEGGHTTSTRMAADGGYISGPGGPRDDLIPARLSNGEFVVNAKATDRHRPILEAINSHRYADGGLVVHGSTNVPASTNISGAFSAGAASLMAAAFGSMLGGGAGSLLAGLVPAGSGVARWAPLVRSVLAMEHLAGGLLGRVLSQMNTESGGNPRAINLWDINAKRGTPSKGLMQVIDPTFRAYHWPGTSWNIYDPRANVAAAVNYARHRYGAGLSALGHGHGYDSGGVAHGAGWIPKPTRAPERVLSPRQTVAFERLVPLLTRGGGAGEVNVHLIVQAPNYVGDKDDLVGALGQLSRQGRLDDAVRRALGRARR